MIAKLAAKDIRHEWLLSACLMLAIASIIAPLLILFGLKYGTINTLRSRLIQDPKNREMRPVTSTSFTNQWFKTARNLEGVSFIVPMTRRVSSTVDAVIVGKKKTRLDLFATAPGDPLLTENGTGVPGPGECVLTYRAAQKLGAIAGDTVTLKVRRITQGSDETEDLSIRIVGILDQRASGLKLVFVRLEMLEAVEDFKDGKAVPRYDWPGHEPIVYPVFDGAVVLTPGPLTEQEQQSLVNNTGFSKVRKLDPKEVQEKLEHPLAETWSAYFVFVKQLAVEIDSINAVRHRLRVKHVVVVPWVKPLHVALKSESDSKWSTEISLSSWFKPGPAGGVRLPDSGETNREDDTRRLILLPQESTFPDGPASLRLQEEGRNLEIPVQIVHGQYEKGQALAASQLIGSLNLLRYRNIKYNKKTDNLLLSRKGYAGFRLYAKNIDVVETVEKQLEEQGVEVYTKSVRIAEVQRLDSYLSRIFWIIALVGVIGGISALAASLYASVERKKKELNILRLIGCYKMEVLRFPIYQGLGLAGGGLVLASLFFLLVARIINTLFSSHLGAYESLCSLTPGHFVSLFVGVLGLSTLAAISAAYRVTKMDPAEALRDE